MTTCDDARYLPVFGDAQPERARAGSRTECEGGPVAVAVSVVWAAIEVGQWTDQARLSALVVPLDLQQTARCGGKNGGRGPIGARPCPAPCWS